MRPVGRHESKVVHVAGQALDLVDGVRLARRRLVERAQVVQSRRNGKRLARHDLAFAQVQRADALGNLVERLAIHLPGREVGLDGAQPPVHVLACRSLGRLDARGHLLRCLLRLLHRVDDGAELGDDLGADVALHRPAGQRGQERSGRASKTSLRGEVVVECVAPFVGKTAGAGCARQVDLVHARDEMRRGGLAPARALGADGKAQHAVQAHRPGRHTEQRRQIHHGVVGVIQVRLPLGHQRRPVALHPRPEVHALEPERGFDIIAADVLAIHAVGRPLAPRQAHLNAAFVRSLPLACALDAGAGGFLGLFLGGVALLASPVLVGQQPLALRGVDLGLDLGDHLRRRFRLHAVNHVLKVGFAADAVVDADVWLGGLGPLAGVVAHVDLVGQHNAMPLLLPRFLARWPPGVDRLDGAPALVVPGLQRPQQLVAAQDDDLGAVVLPPLRVDRLQHGLAARGAGQVGQAGDPPQHGCRAAGLALRPCRKRCRVVRPGHHAGHHAVDALHVGLQIDIPGDAVHVGLGRDGVVDLLDDVRHDGLHAAFDQCLVVRSRIDVLLDGLLDLQRLVLAGDVAPLQAGLDAVAAVVRQFLAGILGVRLRWLCRPLLRLHRLCCGRGGWCWVELLPRINEVGFGNQHFTAAHANGHDVLVTLPCFGGRPGRLCRTLQLDDEVGRVGELVACGAAWFCGGLGLHERFVHQVAIAAGSVLQRLDGFEHGLAQPLADAVVGGPQVFAAQGLNAGQPGLTALVPCGLPRDVGLKPLAGGHACGLDAVALQAVGAKRIERAQVIADGRRSGAVPVGADAVAVLVAARDVSGAFLRRGCRGCGVLVADDGRAAKPGDQVVDGPASHPSSVGMLCADLLPRRTRALILRQQAHHSVAVALRR